ncbi:MAG: GSCFA domain-containing protein [Rikenellaceae bacterium]
MKLQTEVVPQIYNNHIDYSSRVSMLGSCFTISIAQKLLERKFKINYNPLGTIYNPLSIVNTLKRLEKGDHIEASELFFKNEVWGHFEFNTTFSNTDSTSAIETMNRSIDVGHKALVDSDFLIITLGTSRCYFKKSDSLPVNNCHKLPSDTFSHRLLTSNETVDMFSELFSSEFYKSKNIIFTVSPVRHIKDGLTANSVSKAHLLIAVSQLCHKFENVSYFPSYEIFNDELRDYRFYNTDLIHPSDAGIQYVWERFASCMISKPATFIMKEVEGIMRDFNHRPINIHSDSFIAFRDKLLTKASALEKNFTTIDFSNEKEFFL